ncbi:hypothetical protein [Methylobacterium radiotolerans]|uniref:Nmad2 family putative nucleotide modification protein n=1 Tax=Methylobacterium radiotolerans TaxID=31998 RepID=UPI00237F90E8|nr:hypothetical protein [Methylobacterium radiotolerans]MDE3745105.1 hypothetical protein [Methylobacterium radiotolerans]
MYVMSYDFGFAPNPFHGVCTLACCKPDIRRTARVSDWIVGVGGGKLKATGRCIFAMQVTGAMTFDEYWNSDEFRVKRPKRNGSLVVRVGDNVYHTCSDTGRWLQEDCVHSQPGGTQDPENTGHDTGTDRILISRNFIYFGDNAPRIPDDILASLPYKNGRAHRVYPQASCARLLEWIQRQAGGAFNRVLGDPYQLSSGHRYYSKSLNRMV